MKQLTILTLFIGLTGCSSIVELGEITAKHPAHSAAEIAKIENVSLAWQLDPISHLNEADEDMSKKSNHDSHKMHNMKSDDDMHDMHKTHDMNKIQNDDN